MRDLAGAVTALGSDTPQVTGVESEEQAPRFVVRAPYPNPAPVASGALFSASLPGPTRVRVDLFDVTGRLVASRPEEASPAGGPLSFRWAPSNLPAGTYVVRFAASGGLSRSVKWTVLRQRQAAPPGRPCSGLALPPDRCRLPETTEEVE
jgi:hypothetical protein